MSGPFLATVVYRQCKNCFVSVPREWLSGRTNTGVQVYDVHYNVTQRAVLSWSGEFTTQSGFLGSQSTIEINGFYAVKLGLVDGSQVVVTPKENVRTLEYLTAEPLAIDDWEILELHASYVQENLMNQVRVVWDGQVLPIWVNQSVCIFVKIGGLDSARPYGVLEQNSEVAIVPKARETERNTSNLTEPEPPLLEDETAPAADGNLPQDSEENTNGWSLRGYVSQAIGTLFPGDEGGNLTNQTVKHAHAISGDYSESAHSDEQQHRLVKNIGNYVTCTLRAHPVDTAVVAENLVGHGGQSTGGVSLASLLVQPTTAFVLSESLVDGCWSGEMPQRVPFVFARIKKCSPPFESSTPDSADEKLKKLTKKSEAVKSSDGVAESKMTTPGKLKGSVAAAKTASCFVRLVIVDHVTDYLHRDCDVHALDRLRRLLVPGVVLLQDVVKQQLACETAHPVRLSFDVDGIARPTSIQLLVLQNVNSDVFPLLTTESLLKQSFAKLTSDDCPLLITNNNLIELSSQVGQCFNFIVKVSGRNKKSDNDDTPFLITPLCKVNFNLKPSEEKVPEVCDASQLDLPIIGLMSAALGGVDDILRDCLTSLKLALGLGPLSQHLRHPYVASGGLLLCGSSGSGKTALASSLCREFSASPYYVFPSVVSCKSLKGKRVETISKLWKRVYKEAVFRAPSIVILDDLDQVLSAPSGPENEIGSVAVYHAKLADSLREIMKEVSISRDSRVVTIATCPHPTTIHKTVSAPQGLHLFPNVIQLEAPNLDQREDVLKHVILSKTFISSDCLTSIDWRPLSVKLEGFVARDLEMVVDRASHSATARNSEKGCAPDKQIELTDEDFKSALEDFVPIALRGLQLHVPGKLGWADVGGLKQVKKTLVETLQWPTKHPELFSKCPLAMRSGILLYGPPGTGKTLLANVVAKECSMGFISIKGPELLSKYIGASEQSVRDLFERAANAKPCVIFFDEFDSLAPRRGHDSTGVTDRVVNQLLTQMDGVEGRKGVYVLAATSRPDLIDPALLRPGRLDKCLYCPLPATEERCEILKALSRSVTLSDDVDLEGLADACSYFSGADLQGLLYNAQLRAIHRTLDDTGSQRVSTVGSGSSPEIVNVDDFDIIDRSNCDAVRSDSSWSDLSSPDRRQRAFTHVPSLEDGLVALNNEVNDAVCKQIEILSYNINGWPETVCADTGGAPRRTIVVTHDDLLCAVGEMNPSVSETDRRRYDTVYQMFMKARGGGYFDSGTNSTVDQRATLA